MDIEFLVHDIYSGTRPQWKLANNFEEASKAFQLVLAQDRKAAGLDEVEVDEDEGPSGPPTDDENAEADADEDVGSEDGEADVSADTAPNTLKHTKQHVIEQDDEERSSVTSEDEAIVVTREEEEIDLEADADFEREFQKMMSESLESRKLERKPVFDVALPVRARARETTTSTDQAESNGPAPKMAFQVLTKRGNKQMVSFQSPPCGVTNA